MGSLQGASAANVNGRRARRVLVFPLSCQGHINPMMQLADVLHSRGLGVTVLHTRFNALDPLLHPEFTFVDVPDVIPADVAASGSIISIILALNAAMEASGAVHGVLASVLADKPATCLFIDANLLPVQKAAAALGLPTIVLRTGSAACFCNFLAYPMLHEKGYLPPKETQLYTPVEELPPLRVRDLFLSSINNHEMVGKVNNNEMVRKVKNHEMVRKVLARATETVRNSHGLVINTFEALETAELERIRGELDVAVVLAAGPLHKLSNRGNGSSLLQQDRSCIQWLETQAAGSVLYVSFGSLVSMEPGELTEAAWGLANSGQPFLWVVRRDLVRGSDGQCLPEGFDSAVEGRGMVIPWAPQQEVLAHSAVGAFWTHSGWNSTLESIGEGLPMICRPQLTDQMMNTRYVEAAWGVGFELEGELERNKIEEAIRNLMKGSHGEVMRERSRELKKKVETCLEIDGSSMLAIDKLIDYITSL